MAVEEAVLARAALLVLEGSPEEAVEILAGIHGVPVPRIKIGLPRRYSRVLGCYDHRRRLICLRSSSEYRNPLVVLHEYYHHLRAARAEYSGYEKGADRFAARAVLACLRFYGERCRRLLEENGLLRG